MTGPLHRSVLVAAALAVVAVFLALASVPLRRTAPGLDEVAYVGAARYVHEHGVDGLTREHPPLVKRLAGAAMALAYDAPLPHATVDATRWDAQWLLGTDTLAHGGRFDQRLMQFARLPLLAIGLWGLVAAALFAYRLAGRTAAWGTAIVYAASPAILAGASMVLTDLTVGVFSLSALLAAHVAACDRRPAFALLSGAFAAAAMLSKYSGVAVVPIVLTLVVLQMAVFDRGGARAIVHAVAAFLAGVVAGAVLLSGSMTLVDYLEGFGLMGQHLNEGYRYYAYGQVATGGFWWYFPFVLAVKSTLPELFGIAAIAGLLLFQGAHASVELRFPQRLSQWLWLASFPGAYLLSLMLKAPDMGQRYLTPLYPFLCVAAGVMVTRLAPRMRVAVLASAGVLQVGSALAALPTPMTFFNGLAGCRSLTAMRCLDDANIDWGQSMNELWAGLEPHLGPGEVPYVDLYTALPVSTFLPRHSAMGEQDWRHPRPGLYVLSPHMVVRRIVGHANLDSSPLVQSINIANRVAGPYLLVDLRRPPATGPAPAPDAR